MKERIDLDTEAQIKEAAKELAEENGKPLNIGGVIDAVSSRVLRIIAIVVEVCAWHYLCDMEEEENG